MCMCHPTTTAPHAGLAGPRVWPAPCSPPVLGFCRGRVRPRGFRLESTGDALSLCIIGRTGGVTAWGDPAQTRVDSRPLPPKYSQRQRAWRLVQLPWGLRGRSPLANAGGVVLIPGSRRSPGGGNATPVFLPGESHGQRSREGYRLWGLRVRHD